MQQRALSAVHVEKHIQEVGLEPEFASHSRMGALSGGQKVKVVLAVIDALNDIPLLAPTFELVGIAYSAWFVNRYLLQASHRQELAQEIEKLKGKVVGSQQL